MTGRVPQPQTLLKAREFRPPRLLVSVRNATEAVAAFAGGCDVLDIKEPAHGPLGMAASEEISAISQAAEQQAPQTLLSAALGELGDWSKTQPPPLADGIDIAKLGPAGFPQIAAWKTQWRNVRQRFEQSSNRQLSWIAVAYADWRQAHSPAPQEILAAIQEDDCAGLLIDTSTKSGRGLFDWMSIAELRSIAEQTGDHGKTLALAGQLSLADLPKLHAVNPDIIAIRSAACRDENRSFEIHSTAVRNFKTAIAATHDL